MSNPLYPMDRRRLMKGALAVGAGAALGGIDEAYAQSVELRLQNFFPKSPTATLWLLGEKLNELMKAKSNGDIDVKHFPVGALVQIPDFVPATQRGTIDMFVSNDSMVFSTFPWMEWNGVPGMTEWPEEFMDVVYKKGLFEYIGKLVEARGLKLVSMFSFGATIVIASRSKLINKLDDLQGLKLRTPGALFATSLSAAGGSAVSMPPSEVYTALQTGVVDGLTTGSFTYASLRLNEVAPFATHVGDQVFGSSTGSFYMSLNRFNKLSKKDQNAVTEAGREAADYAVTLFSAQDKEFLENAQKLGVTLKVIPRALGRQWTAKVQPAVLKVYLDRGGPEAKKIVEMVQAATGRKL